MSLVKEYNSIFKENTENIKHLFIKIHLTAPNQTKSFFLLLNIKEDENAGNQTVYSSH